MSNFTLQSGISALESLTEILPQALDECVPPILGCFGKLIVTGMGKAGLIGQKISATLRSTGQPSAFLDPAQALHGDMGMIRPGDVLLALSNSGQTAEVEAVIMYARSHEIPVIAITSDAGSPIAGAADVSIVYPRMPEGCPIGRAPMASTMQMMAIGDAIAAELMMRRGFSDADFLALHHGGYLGQQIREVVKPESD